MRTITYVFLALAGCIHLAACSDDKYTSNHPEADPQAPSVYDVNELYQEYATFFKPSRGWVGDPMPFYENGQFHLFYLQDARDGAPTFHPIYKAVTADFISYEDSGEMIPCGEDNSREDALGTGSIIKEGNTYYFFYTAHNASLDPREEVNYAVSTDLIHWEKRGYATNGWKDGYDRNEFRDPLVLKGEDGRYTMLVTTRADYKGSWRAVIAQYTSDSLEGGWELGEPFYDSTEAFNLECPDVFVMGGYQYLIFSEQNDRRGVHYVYRTIDATRTGEWIVPENNFLDGYAYYAAKTASDNNNRYLFGWCPTKEGHSDSKGYDWAGALVVHRLIQQENGELRLGIPASVDAKLNSPVTLKTEVKKQVTANGNSYLLKGEEEKAVNIFSRFEKGAQKIEAVIKSGTAQRFGIELGAGGNRKYVYELAIIPSTGKVRLDYVVSGSVAQTLTEALLPESTGNEYHLKVVIENSVCVAYVNDKVALTNRIYQMNRNPWGIFAKGGEATFEVGLFQ